MSNMTILTLVDRYPVYPDM